jgi:hypothetical protein
VQFSLPQGCSPFLSLIPNFYSSLHGQKLRKSKENTVSAYKGLKIERDKFIINIAT